MDTLSQQPLDVKLTCFINLCQLHFLPLAEEELGVLTSEQRTFVKSFALISKSLPRLHDARDTGRAPKSRLNMLKVFFMKSLLNEPTTRKALERLRTLPSWMRAGGTR